MYLLWNGFSAGAAPPWCGETSSKVGPDSHWAPLQRFSPCAQLLCLQILGTKLHDTSELPKAPKLGISMFVCFFFLPFLFLFFNFSNTILISFLIAKIWGIEICRKHFSKKNKLGTRLQSGASQQVDQLKDAETSQRYTEYKHHPKSSCLLC